jgi:hypothetical protein
MVASNKVTNTIKKTWVIVLVFDMVISLLLLKSKLTLAPHAFPNYRRYKNVSFYFKPAKQLICNTLRHFK